MKYVGIYPSDKLRDITERVGVQNTDQILADNGLPRVPPVGDRWKTKCDQIMDLDFTVSNLTRKTILNTFVDHLDIYQEAALADEYTWKVLQVLNTFPNYLYVSDQIENSIPNSVDVLGNNIPVPPEIYKAVNALLDAGAASGEFTEIDPSIFSAFSTIPDVGILSARRSQEAAVNPMSWFKLPDNQITLYSSLSGDSIAIPVYPEELSDSRSASYTTMPDLIYQYEPWQMYQSSGPRSQVYEFHMHRDMWTGDHRDGKANELIRFCQAQCYPHYNGSSVNSATITLYISGFPVITGIMTQVDVDWSGPLGLDGWYLEFRLRLSITEVSADALDYATVRSKPLIG